MIWHLILVSLLIVFCMFFQGMMVVQSIIFEVVVTPHLWSLGESIRIIWVCPLMTRMKAQRWPLAQPLQKSTHIVLFFCGCGITNHMFPISRSNKTWICFCLSLYRFKSSTLSESVRPTRRSPWAMRAQQHLSLWTCKQRDLCRFQHEFVNLEDVSSQLWIAKTYPWFNETKDA